MESEPINQPIISTVQNNEHPKSNIFLIILLFILLIISTSIAVFFAYQTQKLIKEINALKVVPTPISTISPTAAPVQTESALIDITSWETYVNTKKGYSLKYPQKWYMKVKTYSDGTEGIEFDSTKEDISSGYCDSCFRVEVIFEPGEIPDLSQYDFKKFLVNNNEGVRGIVDSTIGRTDQVYIQGAKGYVFFTFFVPGVDNGDSKVIFDKILSTFKFTN